MIRGNFKSELKSAAGIVWIICSVIILSVIVMTLLSPDTLLGYSPVCLSKSLSDTECFMCGMTRAFTEISEGNYDNAFKLNSLSLYLFSVMSLNSLILIFYLLFKLLSYVINFKKRIISNFQNKNLFQN